MTDVLVPAWSEPFSASARERLTRLPPVAEIDRALAFGGATGAGVRVAILDSGLERAHPALNGRVVESVAVELDREGEPHVVDDEP